MSFTGTMRLVVAGFIAVGIAACSSDDGRGQVGVSDAGATDAGADAAGTDAIDGPDADAGSDAASDTGADAGADVTTDAQADAALDTSASFTTTPDDLAVAGETWAWDVGIEGIPAAALTLRFDGAPEAQVIEPAPGGWSVTWAVPLEAPTADLEIVAEASRDGALVATSSFTLRVRHRPVFADAPPPTAWVGQVFAWTPTVRDTDGGPIVLELTAGPDWLALDDATVGGTPTGTGEATFVLRATDEDGLEATTEARVEVVTPIEDLRASPLWSTTAGVELTLVGCCFDGTVDVLVGGVAAATVDRVNAARVDASFGALPPGEHDVVVLIDGTERGRAPDPLVVVPDVHVVSADPLVVETPAVEHTALGLRGWTSDGVVALDVTAGEVVDDTVRLTVDAADAPGAIAVAMDGIVGVPAPIVGAGAGVLVDASPVVHAGGSTVRVELGGAFDGLARFRWTGGGTASAEVVDGVANVRVPAAADGRLELVIDDAPAPAVVAAAVSDAAYARSPEVAHVTRRVDAAGRFTRLLVRGLGAGHPSVASDVLGAPAAVLDAGDGWMLFDLTDTGTGAASGVLTIGGRGAAIGPVARLGRIDPRGADVVASPVGTAVDPNLVGVGLGPAVRVGDVHVAITSGGALAATGSPSTAFGVELVDGGWTSLGAPTEAPAIDVSATDDALVVLDAAGRLVVWPLDGAAEVWTGPVATRIGVEDTAVETVRWSGATAIAAHRGVVFGAIPDRGQVVAVGLETTAAWGVEVSARQTRVVGVFEAADTAWIAAGGPCVAVGTPGTITQWEGLGSGGGSFETDLAEGAPGDGQRIDAFGPIDDLTMTETYAWVVSGRTLYRDIIGSRCISSGATLERVGTTEGVGAVSSNGVVSTFAGPGLVVDVTAATTHDAWPAGGVFAVDDATPALRSGAVRSAAPTASGVAIADANHVVADRAHVVPGGVPVGALADGRTVAQTFSGAAGIWFDGDRALEQTSGALAAGASPTPVHPAVRVVGLDRDAPSGFVTDPDGGVHAMHWLLADSLDRPLGTVQFIGGRGVDAAGPVGPTEAAWGDVRSVVGTANDGVLDLWLVDGDGQLWRVADATARRVVPGIPTAAGCLDGPPGALRSVAEVVPGQALWLVDERGQVHAATVEGDAVVESCATGLGGVPGGPGGLAWGTWATWSSRADGLTVVDRAAGFATAFVVSR